MRIVLFILIAVLSTARAHAGDAVPAAAPKYEALRFVKVNMHAGPGQQYPVLWVYQRRGLPVEITGSYDVWKKVVDPDGTTGWVQETMLSDKRTVLVKGKQRTLRHDPRDDAEAVALAEPGTIAKVQSCASGWCAIKFDAYEGWMKESELWGLDKNESFDTKH